MTVNNKTEIAEKKKTVNMNAEQKVPARKIKEDFVGARKIIRRSLF